MPCGSPSARRGLVVRAAAFLLLALLLALLPGSARTRAAAYDDRPAAGSDSSPDTPRRPRVLQPRIELTPAAIEIDPGSRVQFVARAAGGEAMRLSLIHI